MKKNKKGVSKEFVIFSEYGFFTGLKYGGVPQWSLNINEAKPFDHMEKLDALQRMYYGELLIEFI
jgi:hypothetical protein